MNTVNMKSLAVIVVLAAIVGVLGAPKQQGAHRPKESHAEQKPPQPPDTAAHGKPRVGERHDEQKGPGLHGSKGLPDAIGVPIDEVELGQEDKNLHVKVKEVVPVKDSTGSQRASEPWRVCYFTNWAQYRPEPGLFEPEDAPVSASGSLCTHISYAFAFFEDNDMIIVEANDIDLYQRVNNLKNRDPNLKTMLAVGGWTFGTSRMTLMLSSKENRTELIGNMVDWLRTYNFDGVDIDLEYPGGRGSETHPDKFLFTCFIKELREAFDAENPSNPLLLVVGVAAGLERVLAGYEIAAISGYVDKVMLMAYDFFGGFSPVTGPNAGLYPRPGMSELDATSTVNSSVNLWVSGGCPRHKLLLGLPSYGRGNTLLNPLDNTFGSPSIGASREFEYSGTDGHASYYEICAFHLPLADVVYSPYHRIPYGSNGDQWLSWDNTRSIEEKVSYLKEQQLGGFMFWTITDDDFGGSFCGEGTFPLLKEANRGLLGYTVPDPAPVPDPDVLFCLGLPDGYYKDPEDCGRFYQCEGGSTTVAFCPQGSLYDPLFTGCRFQSQMNQTQVCLECSPYCMGCYDCETSSPDFIC